MTNPDLRIECMAIIDEAHKNGQIFGGALSNEPILEEEVMISGREAVRRRCVECSVAILRLKDSDGKPLVDIPEGSNCLALYGRSLLSSYDTASPVEPILGVIHR